MSLAVRGRPPTAESASMSRRLTILAAVVAAASSASPIAAQSVLVDEGTFSVTRNGKAAGTEEFTIRRAGMGNDAVVISSGVIRLDGPDGKVELRPLLETVVPDGAASSYQLKVAGAQSAELSLALAGRRYVSRIRTDAGEEEREFVARPETRIVEEGVAHHYYFLRDAREGSKVPVIEPRTRRQFQLTVSPATDEEIRIGSVRVQAHRVTFAGGDADRTVWFDRQGRVLRVEIPGRGYVAERQDLVG